MNIPENITLAQAKELLKNIKAYSDITKKLGHRGRWIFSRNLSGESVYLVEYHPSLWEDAAWEMAQRVYERSFTSTPERKNISFAINDGVKGGIKVYKDDFMVDMSFDWASKKIQK